MQLRRQLELAYEQIDDMSKQLAAKERQLNMRHVEKLRLERACTGYKSQLERAELKIKHLELRCERNATLVARREQERKDRQAIASYNSKNLSTLKWRLLDVDGLKKLRETRNNEQFEAKLNQLAAQIDAFDKKCTNRMSHIDDLDRHVCAKLEATTMTAETPNDSGLTVDEENVTTPPSDNVEVDEGEQKDEEEEAAEEEVYSLPVVNQIQPIQQQQQQQQQKEEEEDDDDDYYDDEEGGYYNRNYYQPDDHYGYY